MKRATMVRALVLVLVWMSPAIAQDGMIRVKSSHDVATTADRLVGALQEKGTTVFARIDHAEEARRLGQTMLPTQLIIFGDPAMGTPLIQRSRTIGIDLPLKALIWEDRTGQVWFAYNTIDYLVRRHGITELGDRVRKMAEALAGLAQVATQP